MIKKRNIKKNLTISISMSIILIVLIGFFINFNINLNNSKRDSGLGLTDHNNINGYYILPHSALISDSQITYKSQLVRVLDTQRIEVDLSVGNPSATFVNMSLNYPNSSITVYNLTEIGSTDVWFVQYTHAAQDPIGSYNFTIFIYNGAAPSYNLVNTSNVQFYNLNNSPPNIGIELSNTTIYRNNTLFFNLTPSDAEDSLEKLQWKADLYFGTSLIQSYSSGQLINLNHTFAKDLADSYLGQYHIIANVTDSDGNSSISVKYFDVKNNVPYISWYSINISDSEFTDPSKHEVLRGTGTINIALNISDVELPHDSGALNVKMIAKGTDNQNLNFGIISSITRTSSNPAEKSDFKCTVVIPSYTHAEEFTLYLTAYEVINNVEYNSSVTYTFNVINNPPNASRIVYTINDQNATTQGITIKEFQNINIKVNVTNVDSEGIAKVRICLIDPNGKWYNYSLENNGSNFVELTLRAYDLAEGQWYVYVYVVDTDGYQVAGSNILSFRLVRDKFSVVIPWLMLFAGIAIGLVFIGVLIGPKYMNLKREYEELTLAMPSSVSKPRSSKNLQKSKTKSKGKSSKNSTYKNAEENKQGTEKSDEEEAQESDADKKRRKLIRKL